MILTTILALVPQVEAQQLLIENIYGPTQVVIDAPVFFPDRVEIGWHVPDVPFYIPFVFDAPGFDPSWGTCTGTQIEQDLEATWLVGIEYHWWPYPGNGALCSSWWPPNHGDVWWPSRSDVGQPGDNYLGTTVHLDDTWMGYSEFCPPVEYALNSEGIFPHGPSDGIHDWLRTSGAMIVYSDPPGNGKLGPREQIDVSAPTVEVKIVGRGIVTLVFILLGKTSVMSNTLDRTLHGKILYYRQP